MRKTIYTIVSLLLIVIAITGCKKEKIYSVSISKESLTMLVGEQYQLSATILPLSSDKRKITWESSDKSVVSVNSEGLVTAEGIGNATVTVKVENIIAKCDITVMNEGEYKMKVTLKSEGDLNIYKLIVMLPVPLTNEYQDISNISCNYGDNIESCNGNHIFYYHTNTYVDGMEMFETFDHTPKQVTIDFSKAPDKKNEYGGTNPGDFLGNDGEYIDLNNSTIRAIGDSLWALSDGNIDYARKCYDYVANTLELITGGWSTLAEIIREGGGQSEDFSTFYINLLRYKGIPARHNLAFSTSGNWYVFADFYDEDYGWIPVQCTRHKKYPDNDYFGQYKGNYIVVGQGLTTFEKDGLQLIAEPLQYYYYYYWYSSGSGELKIKYKFEGSEE